MSIKKQNDPFSSEIIRMKNMRALYMFPFCIMTLLAGCADTQVQSLEPAPTTMLPKELGDKKIYIAAQRPSKEVASSLVYAVDGHSLFVSKIYNRSAGTFLLGPLAAMAQDAEAKDINIKLAKKGKSSNLLALDALTEASSVLGMEPTDAESDPDGIVLKPYVVLLTSDEKPTIQTIVGIRADASIRNRHKGIIIQYNVVLEPELNNDAFSSSLPAADFEEYKNNIRAAYKQIYADLLHDLHSPIRKKKHGFFWAPAFKAFEYTRIGVGVGDLDISPDGKLSLFLDSNRGGIMPDKYYFWNFPSSSKYRFEKPPIDYAP